MKRLILPIIVLLTIITVSFEPQIGNRVQYLEILHVDNKLLEPILDSIIEYDSHCDYYSPDLMYDIRVRSFKDTVDEYYIAAFGLVLFDMGDNYYNGCFEHKGHWFVVKWEEQSKTVFSNTNQKKEFILDNAEEKDKNGNMVLRLYEDDSFSFWIYHCVHNIFFLKEKYEIKAMNNLQQKDIQGKDTCH